MPAPIGIYVVTAVAGVVAGYAFKKFVYDPFIAPELQRLREDFLRRRRMHQVHQGSGSNTNYSDDDHNGDIQIMREVSDMETRSTIELENLVARERNDWSDDWRGFVDPSSELRRRNNRSGGLDSVPGRSMADQPDIFIPNLPMSPTMSTLSFDHHTQSIDGSDFSPHSVASSITIPPNAPPVQFDSSIRRPLQPPSLSSLESSLSLSHGLPTPRSPRSPNPNTSLLTPNANTAPINRAVSSLHGRSNIVSPMPISPSTSLQTFNTALSSPSHAVPDLIPDTGSVSRIQSPFSDIHSAALSRGDMTSPFSIAEPSDIETMSSSASLSGMDDDDDDEILSQQFQSAISESLRSRASTASIRTPSEVSFSSSVPDLDAFSENSWENMSASGSAMDHHQR